VGNQRFQNSSHVFVVDPKNCHICSQYPIFSVA
jgi:hypothetical protein